MHLILGTLLQFSFIAIILIVLAFRWKNNEPLKLLGVLYALLIAQVIILTLPRVGFFSELQWNWQGKIIGFVWLLSIVYVFKWLTPKEVGLTAPVQRKWYVCALFAGLIYNILMLSVGLFVDDVLPQQSHINTETILFELIMPGLEEELFFRGVLWAIINRYISSSARLFKVTIGWDFILTTLLFIIIHWVTISSKTSAIGWEFSDNFIVVVPAILCGILRMKSKSIWPGVLLHNTVNGMFLLMVACAQSFL
jgi:membrane protease YdiL (CAAX protease family)